MKTSAQYQSERRARQRKAGLCMTCNKPALPGMAHCAEHHEQRTAYYRELHHAHRREVIEHYGGVCACCGEVVYEFLTIDHIDGGGGQHRKSIGSGIVSWLRKHKYPKEFRVLCANCNQAYGMYGYCPHQGKKVRQNA